jgi:spore coat protein CotH
MNPEFLNLNNPNAVLYKAIAWEDGSTRFETYSNNSPVNYYWDGWEQKYPDPSIEINWSPLNQLRHLVVNGNNEIFTTQIDSLIDVNNLIDYYILLNTTSAMDNTGKNIFLVKENIQDKFSIIPWDLDGSWGVFWNGAELSHTSILSNSLFDRLLETNAVGFKNKLKQRWVSLRGNVLSNIELNQMFTDQFMLINTSEIIDIENRKWGSSIDLNSEKQYLIDWIENRLIFLDNYFYNL